MMFTERDTMVQPSTYVTTSGQTSHPSLPIINRNLAKKHIKSEAFFKKMPMQQHNSGQIMSPNHIIKTARNKNYTAFDSQQGRKKQSATVKMRSHYVPPLPIEHAAAYMGTQTAMGIKTMTGRQSPTRDSQNSGQGQGPEHPYPIQGQGDQKRPSAPEIDPRLQTNLEGGGYLHGSARKKNKQGHNQLANSAQQNPSGASARKKLASHMTKTDAIVSELQVSLPMVHAVSPVIQGENILQNSKKVVPNYASAAGSKFAK